MVLITGGAPPCRVLRHECINPSCEKPDAMGFDPAMAAAAVPPRFCSPQPIGRENLLRAPPTSTWTFTEFTGGRGAKIEASEKLVLSNNNGQTHICVCSYIYLPMHYIYIYIYIYT